MIDFCLAALLMHHLLHTHRYQMLLAHSEYGFGAAEIRARGSC